MACIFNKSDSCCKDAPKQQHGPVCPQKIYRYVSYDDQISKSQLTSKSKLGSKIGCSSSHHMTTEPSALAVQDEIVPLLGGPYFTCIMSDSHVQRHFRLEVPTGFHQFFPSSSALVVLCSRSREWVVRCYVNEHMKLLENGWKRFVVDNNLRVGDGCVFELMDCKEMFQIKLRVQILPGQVPQRAIGEVAVGQSSENPFMIA